MVKAHFQVPSWNCLVAKAAQKTTMPVRSERLVDTKWCQKKHRKKNTGKIMEHVDMKSYTVAIDIRCLFFDSIVLDHHWSTVSFWGADKGQRLNRQVSTSVAMGLCGLFTLQVPKPKLRNAFATGAVQKLRGLTYLTFKTKNEWLLVASSATIDP